jgi:hypothetical protein
MIDIYLGLTHYVLGHWREAAAISIDVVDASLRTRGLRSTAAAIEIAAFLAMRTLRPEACVRLLGKAADIRERTHSPLFSFWVAYDAEAANLARRQLGNEQFDALYAAGVAARDELAIDEARALLREVAEA